MRNAMVALGVRHVFGVKAKRSVHLVKLITNHWQVVAYLFGEWSPATRHIYNICDELKFNPIASTP